MQPMGFNGHASVPERVDYYPFGLIFIPNTPRSSDKYLYNGKGLHNQDLINTQLDWNDYGARFYEPQIVRTIP